MMITVISGTNRPGSRTKIVSELFFELLKESTSEEVKFLDLVDINIPLLTNEMYDKTGQHPNITDIQDNILLPSRLWVIISPEYNGSYPGILKLLIDALSVRRYKETFSGKKAALIGVATGRAGNFRGMEHLTGLLNYLNILVMPNKLPISSVDQYIDANIKLDESISYLLKKHITELLEFNKLEVVRDMNEQMIDA
ncbi:MAG TPA: NAD(P)H-dependent oxidoreductase [Saprospiraceae bacterium]|nr:NAD(P)H-dependent oxidoreductase [Saprospiraceae bacterium]HMU02872.1 NAD(P)H-dependent oxidoreductase [Saprospiraceae bacterium]